MIVSRLAAKKFPVAVIFLCLFVSVANIKSASGVAGLEKVLAGSGLNKSDIRDVLRAYRGAIKVGVDGGRLEELIDRALTCGMEVKDLVKGIGTVTDTDLSGLPVAPVMNKFSEGLAKGVDGEDLVEVLEKRALSLGDARKLVSVLIYEDAPVGNLNTLLVAVADTLERGVKERKIRGIFEGEDLDFNRIILEIEKLR
jgi:hypothetical protein